MALRRCNRCEQEKPLEEFPWRERHLNRRQYYCKECARLATAHYRERCPQQVKKSKAAYWAKNRDRLGSARTVRKKAEVDLRRKLNPTRRPAVGTKFCKGCERTKSASEFYKTLQRADFLSYECKACTVLRVGRWVRENKDKASAGRHRRRARVWLAHGHYTQDDLSAIRKRQRNKCAACWSPLNETAEIDHIRALSKGGSNWPANIQWLCQFCNRSKHDRDPEEFMRSIGRLL